MLLLYTYVYNNFVVFIPILIKTKPIFIYFELKVWQRPYAHVPKPLHSGGKLPNNSCHEINQSTSYPDLSNHHTPPPPPGHPDGGGDPEHYQDQYEELSCPACILQVTHGLVGWTTIGHLFYYCFAPEIVP